MPLYDCTAWWIKRDIHYSVVILQEDNNTNVQYTKGVAHREFSWVSKIADGLSIVKDLQYNLCQKLDNSSASLMRIRHLISNANYPTIWGILLASAKMNCDENSFGALTKRSVIPPVHQKDHAYDLHILVFCWGQARTGFNRRVRDQFTDIWPIKFQFKLSKPTQYG